MTKVAKNRTGRILLVIIFVVVLGVGFYFSDLKIQLFDLPALESKRQSVVKTLSAFAANEIIIEETHYPLRKTPFCLWGSDSWTYKSNRPWSETIRAFDLSFISWEKWRAFSERTYNNGPLFVSIDRNSENLNTDTTYIVRLNVDDPPTPHCGPD